MYKLLPILCILLFFSCAGDSTKSKVKELNLELSKEIDKMARVDQQMQMNMLQFMNSSDEELANIEKIRDQVYEKNAKRAEEILDRYGYPDYNLVGKKSSDNFYTIVVHSTALPKIKNKAVSEMKKVVPQNKDLIYAYSLLVDQTALEQGNGQQYGTVLEYNKLGQAFVKRFQDSTEVDSRRISLGLDSLHIYLNNRTIEYFQLNYNSLLDQGITKPTFY